VTRASATTRVTTTNRETRASAEIGASLGITAKVIGEVKRISGEELTFANDATAAMNGFADVLRVFWNADRCPVLIIDDTDHWGGSPDMADAFFDQTARALGRFDAVTLVGAQTDYTVGDGYLGMRDLLAGEIEVPALPQPEVGLARILQRRVELEEIDVTVATLIETDALELLAVSYGESVVDDKGGDIRRVVAIVRTALDFALEQQTESIERGHVQEAIANHPLAPSSGLGTASDSGAG